MSEAVAFDATGLVLFGGQLLTWNRADVFEVREGRAVPISLGPPTTAPWPSPQRRSELGVVAPQPGLPRLPASLQAPVTSVTIGSTRYALVAAPADFPGLDCPVEQQFSLLRVEGERVVAQRTVGPVSCGDGSPLVAASLEVRDVDADGRVELLARASASASKARIALLVLVDPDGLRVEGALVTQAAESVPGNGALGGRAWLYTWWAIDPTGQTLTRTAGAWAWEGARTRAPSLSACRRDPMLDAWQCTGPSLETVLFRGDPLAAALTVPTPAPRAPAP